MAHSGYQHPAAWQIVADGLKGEVREEGMSGAADERSHMECRMSGARRGASVNDATGLAKVVNVVVGAIKAKMRSKSQQWRMMILFS